ncbi:MAG: DUF424 family protein [Euryarchaeota archaeon]|nr:DUF424 family protein [Euryarchaeota archaeon]
MYVKTYREGRDTLVAACDRELVGREFREGPLKLEVSEGFYKGEPVTCRELAEALRGATIANLVGEKTVQCAIAQGFIDAGGIIRIQGVPHAQLFVL